MEALDGDGFKFGSSAQSKDIQKLMQTGMFEGKIALKLLQDHCSEHVHSAWVAGQVNLFLEMWQVLQHVHRFILLGPDASKAISSDNGNIVYDGLMKIIINASSQKEKVAGETRQTPENSDAVAVPHPEDGVFAMSFIPAFDAILKLPSLIDVLRMKWGLTMKDVISILKDLMDLASKYEYGSESHWWKKIEPEKAGELKHVLDVATASVGTVDGGMMKSKIDEAVKAIAVAVFMGQGQYQVKRGFEVGGPLL